MKKAIFIATTLIFIGCSVNAQKADGKTTFDHNKKGKREFKSQGEQEDYWAAQLFEKKYSRQNFEKFNDSILINGSCFTCVGQTLEIINTASEFHCVFSKGIFYPAIITGGIQTISKSGRALDSLSADQKVFYNLTRTDSLTISNFQELAFLAKNCTQKRFRFWLFRKGSANATTCFVELTNDKATNETSLQDFISGAVVTFFKDGWVGI